ncbi:MAG: sulfotransferase [Reichenbachiella sp.]
MDDKNFLNSIPFSNLAGSRLSVILRLYKKHTIHGRYVHLAILNAMIALLLSFPRMIERIIWKFKLKNTNEQTPPLFILGHWRSGTTHLHNLFCLDDRAGFTTTYQTVFPNNLLVLRKLMKSLMKLLMPPTRPVDNMPLKPNLPQEEEFGMGNLSKICYYHWFYFPADANYFSTQYLTLQTLNPEQKKEWKLVYKSLIQKSLYRQRKTWYVSKNPPNTSRIPLLLETFPNAKFIHIQRNPYQVFESSMRFFSAVIVPLQLQRFTEEELESHILEVFCKIYDNYESSKSQLKSNQIFEIKYEDLIGKESDYMNHIYKNLEINIPDGLLEKWRNGTVKNDRPDRKYSARTVRLVNDALGKRIEEMGYSIEHPNDYK